MPPAPGLHRQWQVATRPEQRPTTTRPAPPGRQLFYGPARRPPPAPSPRRARRRGGERLRPRVAGDPAHEYRLSPGPGELIFGYANLTERAIADGIDALADAVAEIRTRLPGR
ncbi:hypothetical protein [Virgisporangium aurantiacum]|uniref:hypothetical protein n=1 Tax=Virgisporangium aurantiacum TaxID=175570 RepID=UPI00194E766D|nr:hypothetical protein [Virgisporangium aurantiacum]